MNMKKFKSFETRKNDREKALEESFEAVTKVFDKYNFGLADYMTVVSLFVLGICQAIAETFNEKLDLIQKALFEGLSHGFGNFERHSSKEDDVYLIVYRWDEDEPFVADVYGLVSVSQAVDIEAEYIEKGGFNFIEGVWYSVDMYNRQIGVLESCGASITYHD